MKGWRHFVDNDISWTLLFKMGDFSWTFSKGGFSWTLFSTKSHPKRGLLVDKSVHEKTPKSVHEMSPFENVHENSPILKKSVHEMSLSTKCLHPVGSGSAGGDQYPNQGGIF